MPSLNSNESFNLSESDLSALRHMLGWVHLWIKNPEITRNYMAADESDQHLRELEGKGFVRKLSDPTADCPYVIYECTPMGIKAAKQDYKKKVWPLAKRRYRAFLQLKDVYSELSFRDFLVNPSYQDVRNAV